MARPIVLIPHLFRLAGAISFRKDYSPPSSPPSRPFNQPHAHLGVKLDAPDLRRWRLQRGDGRPRVDIEDADEVVELHGDGERVGGVGGEGDDFERVSRAGDPKAARSSGSQARTVSSSAPVRSTGVGRWSAAGAHATAQMDSSWASSTDLSPASFISPWPRLGPKQLLASGRRGGSGTLDGSSIWCGGWGKGRYGGRASRGLCGF